MSDKWINRVQLELKEIKDENLPYFLEMNDVNYVPLEGKCQMFFMVSLDDDIAKEDGEIKLQRANSSRLITIQADVSIRVRPGTSIREPTMSYPYSEPKFTLVSGEGFFPTSFNVSRGDRLKYENYCWNSSLYICDLIAGIATQIRRSIRSGNLSLLIEKESEDRLEKTSLSSKKSTLMSKLNRLKELRGYLLKSKEKDGSSSPEPDSKKGKKDRQLRKLRGILRKTMVEENDLPTTNNKELDDSSEESFELDEVNNLNKDCEHRLVSSDSMTNSIKEKLSLDVIAEEEDDMSDSSDSVSVVAIAGSARQDKSYNILYVSDSPENIGEIEKRDEESSRRGLVTFNYLESERDESIIHEISSVEEMKKMEETNNKRREGNNDETNNDDFAVTSDIEAYETSSTCDTLEEDEDYDDCNYDIEKDKENVIKEPSLSDEWHVSVKNEVMPIVPGIEETEISPQQLRSIDDNIEKNSHRELLRSPGTSNVRISSDVKKGDLDVSKIINLSQHPYDKAHGHFQCKMIKRPAFMKDQLKKEVFEVSGAMIS